MYRPPDPPLASRERVMTPTTGVSGGDHGGPRDGPQLRHGARYQGLRVQGRPMHHVTLVQVRVLSNRVRCLLQACPGLGTGGRDSEWSALGPAGVGGRATDWEVDRRWRRGRWWVELAGDRLTSEERNAAIAFGLTADVELCIQCRRSG